MKCPNFWQKHFKLYCTLFCLLRDKFLRDKLFKNLQLFDINTQFFFFHPHEKFAFNSWKYFFREKPSKFCKHFAERKTSNIFHNLNSACCRHKTHRRNNINAPGNKMCERWEHKKRKELNSELCLEEIYQIIVVSLPCNGWCLLFLPAVFAENLAYISARCSPFLSG